MGDLLYPIGLVL